MARSKRVEVGWEHPETEEAFRVICTVTPGTPERGPSYASGGEPASDPEVEVLEVIEDRPGGQERPDLVALVEQDLARIEESALEQAYEAQLDAMEAEAEAAAEARAESRWDW